MKNATIGLVRGTIGKVKRRLLMRWEGPAEIRQQFYQVHGRQIDLSKMETFTEKLCCRMIEIHHGKNKKFAELTDKLGAREYIKSELGLEYLPALLWRGASPDAIPFGELPARSVAKTNHGSGGNIILSEHVDQACVRLKLRQWLGENYYWRHSEFQYFNIIPEIMIEEFIDDGAEDGPLDYRFFCFHGSPAIIQVDNHSHTINPFYDLTWKRLPLYYRESMRQFDAICPNNLDEMIWVASRLSREFDFVRVDLYNSYNKIYCGELTFTPVAGRLKIVPPSWDAILGAKWRMRC